MNTLKPFPCDTIRPLPGFDAVVKAFQAKSITLDENARCVEKSATISVFDLSSVANAIDHIHELPKPGEVFHCVCKGNYQQFDIVPAIIKLAGCAIDMLHLVTLAFSSQNVQAICELLDSGQVKRCDLTVSTYFKAQNKDIYEHAQHELTHLRNVPLIAPRSHAKIIAAKLMDGRTVTSEGSANLRSNRNIEQFTMTANSEVFEFHERWILDLFRKYAVEP